MVSFFYLFSQSFSKPPMPTHNRLCSEGNGPPFRRSAIPKVSSIRVSRVGRVSRVRVNFTATVRVSRVSVTVSVRDSVK